jgi:hypothetical protein
MARESKSTFQGCLPVLHKNDVWGISWGLVAGKTLTMFNWDTVKDLQKKLDEGQFCNFPDEKISEPKLWFHDIFRKGGIPYDQSEVDFLRQFTESLLEMF